MPTDINNENLVLKFMNTKHSKPYVDGDPGPSLREGRKVMSWANIANEVHTLWS